MARNEYVSFAVVGGGKLGSRVISGLSDLKARVDGRIKIILLSRLESPDKPVPAGVCLVKADYTDVSAIVDVLDEHRVDVVLSTVAADVAGSQKPLVEAAKLAAVKLFVPSEYGIPAPVEVGGMFLEKLKIIEQLESLSLPYTIIHNGLFIESIPWITGYADTGKVTLVGKGTTPISTTSVEDIAGFIAYAATHAPASALENQVLRLQGERMPLNKLGDLFHAPVEHVDKITGPGAETKTLLLRLLDSGAGSTGWDPINKREGTGSEAAGSGNALWPGHEWRSVRQVLGL